jgi:hypothetical protein
VEGKHGGDQDGGEHYHCTGFNTVHSRTKHK